MREYVDAGGKCFPHRIDGERMRRDLQPLPVGRFDDGAQRSGVERRSGAGLDRDLDDGGPAVGEQADPVPCLTGIAYFEAVSVGSPRCRRIATACGDERTGCGEAERVMLGEGIRERRPKIQNAR